MDRTQNERLVKDHLEDGEIECRWCFAVDMQRINGKIIATYNFTDATLVHLKCPRCSGEYTLYIQTWEENYLNNIILKLHPELDGRINHNLFNEINDHVWPEYLGI